MNRALVRVPLAALAVALASCAAIAGLDDHEAFPSDAGTAPSDANVVDTSFDAGPCGRACSPGYACVDKQCTSSVIEVAASNTASCVVLVAGEVWCWGSDQLGELGVPPSSVAAACSGARCRWTPARVPGISSAVHVAVGSGFACALAADATVTCWGGNAHGYLGHAIDGGASCDHPRLADGGSGGSDPCDPTPKAVTFPAGVKIAQIAAGSEGACARTTNGDVYCWGDNVFGAVGKNPVGGTFATPYRVPGVKSDATSITYSGSYGHACALRGFGSVSCWGFNASSELGHPKGDVGDQMCPFGVPCNGNANPVNGLLGSTALTAGQLVTCARSGDGTVKCWGGNDSAQLGNGSSVDNAAHSAPAAVQGLANVVAIEERFLTGFAIDGTANVLAWGLSSNGATGTGDSDAGAIACGNGLCTPAPQIVSGLAGSVQIATGRAGGIALKRDGSVLVWGLNDVGQLGHAPGDGDAICRDGPCRTTPIPLVGLP